MLTLSLTWAFLLTIVFFIGREIKGLYPLFLGTLSLVLIVISYLFFPGKEIFFFPFFYLSIYLYFNREKILYKKDLVFYIYIFIAIFIVVAGFFHPQVGNFVILFSLLLLFFRKYKSNVELFLWGLTVVSVSVSFFLDRYTFEILNSLFIFHIGYKIITEYKRIANRNKNLYKNIFDTGINTELQRYYAEINDQLSIAYRRLREIFKLSNKTIKPIDIEEILENVTNGLSELGYTGILVAVDYKNFHTYKKYGYFPNLEFYLKNKFPEIEKLEISEDEKFVHIPLFSDDGKIGVLSVYKKDKISPSEIEYLRTYANSVAISIAKTLYFKELGLLENIMGKMFEAIDIGIVILNRAFYIEMANKAMEKIFEKKPAGFFFKVYPELQILEEKLKSSLEEKKSLDITISPVEGKGKTYRIKIVPIFLKKQQEKIVLFIEDITEKVKLEAQLIETEKHAVVGKLAAGLSHDIRNPLTTVKAAAFSIKKRAEKNNDDRIKKLAESIEKNSDRAEKIIEKLLNYAKPSYYKKKPVNIKDIIEASIEVSIPSNLKKKIHIKSNIQDALVFADPGSLQQVFVNLLMNAVEALKDDGKIEIFNLLNGEYVEIHIKDNGEGIPEDKIKDIFEPFFTTKEKGTGLGLSVVHKIIKDHNGYIEVKSKQGEGTEFIINLPVYRGEEKDGV